MRIPRVMIKAKSEIMFIVLPEILSTIKAAIKDMGIPIATQNARRRFKKRVRIIKTKTIPCAPLRSSRLILSLTIVERSNHVARFIPSGILYR